MLRLYNFLSSETSNEVVPTPVNSQSHIFLGNHMINDQQKMNAVRYDDRWLSRTDWKAAAWLFPNIMDYNNKHVYARIEELDIV